ncbi:hypothetical protein OC842_006779 [Tilletia horrida]|uniref:Peptidase A1 domain-containing protein n=1 Tax=Tilletia horrida TaxID=155126 RepID=A0AAN6G786_9BASI|nr:hypothetical protein OC842_006779 [Tilletia horrida]
MHVKALSALLSLAMGITAASNPMAVILPRSPTPYQPGSVESYQAELVRRDMSQGPGMIKRCKSQARDASASAPAASPAGATVELKLEDHSPMLPRLMLPMQLGSRDVEVDMYIAGANRDCIVFGGPYDPTQSSSAVSYNTSFLNELGGPRRGQLWSDTVRLSSMTAKNVTVGFVPRGSGGGQCGIAWQAPGASFFGYDDAYSAYLDDLREDGAMSPGRFSIQYQLGGASTMSFGSAVTDPKGSGEWIAADPQAPGFWSVPGALGDSESTFLVVDPSAYSIYGKTGDLMPVIHQLGLANSTFRDEDNLLSATYPCDKAPEVTITVGNVKIPLTKEVMTFGKDAKGDCVLPFKGNDNLQYPSFLGSPFLASIKSIIFDMDTRSLSVVPL